MSILKARLFILSLKGVLVISGGSISQELMITIFLPYPQNPSVVAAPRPFADLHKVPWPKNGGMRIIKTLYFIPPYFRSQWYTVSVIGNNIFPKKKRDSSNTQNIPCQYLSWRERLRQLQFRRKRVWEQFQGWWNHPNFLPRAKWRDLAMIGVG